MSTPAYKAIQRIRSLVIAVALTTPLVAIAEPVAIASAKSPIAPASKEDVASIFLGKTTNIAGTPANPVELKDGSETRDAFYTKFTGKNATQIKAYWAKLVFTGKAPQMKEYDNDAAIKAAVAADPTLVGMVDSASVDGSVKVVGK